MLAQTNIAIARGRYEDPVMADFVASLDRINALAESSPGFVWRYVSDDEDAEAKRAFDDERILFNMSLWQSVESLKRFTYQSQHIEVLRRRSEWFVPRKGPSMALWWQPERTIPTVEDARDRLQRLHDNGSTAEAFTFSRIFGAT